MKLYLDTGNIDEIRQGLQYGVIDGVTTNPSLIAEEDKDFHPTVKEIAELLDDNLDDFTVSAEVTAMDAEGMVEQGRELAQIHENILVKIPLIREGIKAVKQLSGEGIRVNVTLCFSPLQALMAAKAGAYVVSPFVGRLDDIGHDGMDLVRETRDIYDRYGLDTKILAASIRHPHHVEQAAGVGADIVTLPYDVFDQLFNHPLTDNGLESFLDDWKEYKEDH